MELQEIKKLVEYFEDRIIINFEKHFNQLVIMDFYEGGYNDRIEDEFFYEEYFEKYEENIINLLLEIENETSSEFIDFKLRLIKLKRIIDTRLSNLEIKTKDKLLRVTRNKQFILNSNIDKQKFIEILYNQLFHYKLININLEDFKIHFSSNWDDKIHWLGTEPQIVNLIIQLIEKKYLDIETESFIHILITSHFLNKSGNQFKQKQLSTVKSEKIVFVPQDDVIFKIIKEMSTHF